MHAGYRSPNARTLFFGVKALAHHPAAMCSCCWLAACCPAMSTSQIVLYAVGAG